MKQRLLRIAEYFYYGSLINASLIALMFFALPHDILMKGLHKSFSSLEEIYMQYVQLPMTITALLIAFELMKKQWNQKKEDA